MAKKKSIDIGSLTADAQAVILKQVKTAAEAKEKADAEEYKEEVEFYYAVKEALEKKLGEVLASPKLSNKLNDKKYSTAKKLKIIAGLPPKKPTTAAGYVKAHKAIVTGKVGAKKRVAKDGVESLPPKKKVAAKKATPKKSTAKKATVKKA